MKEGGGFHPLAFFNKSFTRTRSSVARSMKF
jgi:hypothetical protein